MNELRTDRLRLEPLTVSHAELLFDELQDPGLYTFIPQEPPALHMLTRRFAFLAGAKSPDGAEDWLNWVAFSVDENRPVGQFQVTVRPGIDANVGYSVFPKYWRNGYGREMAACVIDYVFSRFDVALIYAEIDTRNVGSIAMIESLGFLKVAMTKRADFFKGAPSDEYRFDLIRRRWTECQN